MTSPSSPRPTTIGSKPAADEVASHPVRDHVVVLDDQDLGHDPTIVLCTAHFGLPNGDDLVTRFFRRKDEPDEPTNLSP